MTDKTLPLGHPFEERLKEESEPCPCFNCTDCSEHRWTVETPLRKRAEAAEAKVEKLEKVVEAAKQLQRWEQHDVTEDGKTYCPGAAPGAPCGVCRVIAALKALTSEEGK